MKVTITIESQDDGQYKIVTEDDVAVITEYTKAPTRDIPKILSGLGIKGKRGRLKGVKNPPKAAPTEKIDF